MPCKGPARDIGAEVARPREAAGLPKVAVGHSAGHPIACAAMQVINTVDKGICTTYAHPVTQLQTCGRRCAVDVRWAQSPSLVQSNGRSPRLTL